MLRSDQEEQLISWQPIIRCIARKMCPHDSFVQDDIVQLMNESIIRNFNTIKNKNLLLLSAKLDAIDHLRLKNQLFNYKHRHVQIVYDVDNIADDFDYDKLDEEILLNDAIKSVYPKLTSIQKYVLNLYLLDYDQNEIAKILNRTSGLISVVMKSIKEAIKDEIYTR